MSEQISAIAAFDEIVSKLREPPVVSAAAREIADQLRALADTVRAGRDEQVRGGTSMAMTEDKREMVFELATALSGRSWSTTSRLTFGISDHRPYRPSRGHDGGP